MIPKSLPSDFDPMGGNRFPARFMFKTDDPDCDRFDRIGSKSRTRRRCHHCAANFAAGFIRQSCVFLRFGLCHSGAESKRQSEHAMRPIRLSQSARPGESEDREEASAISAVIARISAHPGMSTRTRFPFSTRGWSAMMSGWTRRIVIASQTTQSGSLSERLDCFEALAPRNDAYFDLPTHARQR
jgi:hypothetical protein